MPRARSRAAAPPADCRRGMPAAGGSCTRRRSDRHARRRATRCALLERDRSRGARASIARQAGDGEPVGVARDDLVLASDGTLAADVRPLVRLNVSVIVEHQGRREQGYAGGGGRFAYAEFRAEDRWRALVREAVRTAQVNLEAVPAPAGTMTVVLGPGWPGVLLHEAIGHGLEGDFNRKGTSAFSGPDRRAGRRAASARSSTTARCRAAAARSTSTTRARRRSARR